MVVGQRGQSGQCVTAGVGGASRSEPAAAPILPLSMEDCLVMDRPFRNWPVPHCVLVNPVYFRSVFILSFMLFLWCSTFTHAMLSFCFIPLLNSFFFCLSAIYCIYATHSRYCFCSHLHHSSWLVSFSWPLLQWTVCGQTGVSGQPVGQNVPSGEGGSVTTRLLKMEGRTARDWFSSLKTARTDSACKVSGR